jgi:hypothetical protein
MRNFPQGRARKSAGFVSIVFRRGSGNRAAAWATLRGARTSRTIRKVLHILFVNPRAAGGAFCGVPSLHRNVVASDAWT